MLGSASGLAQLLWHLQVKLKDFGDWSLELSEKLKAASLAVAEAAGRPVIYLERPGVDKAALAREVAARDGITSGLVCVLKALEPCWSYRAGPDPARKKRSLRKLRRQCLHLYHYYLDPELGFLHGRLQTWLPLDLRVCLNGREWLARQMDQAGLKYARQDNGFLALEDLAAAQRLADAQLRMAWVPWLDELARRISPAQAELLAGCPQQYYWCVDESEYASDVMFEDPQALGRLYRPLLFQGLTTLGSAQALRFLGKKLTPAGELYPQFQGQVQTDLRRRREGWRIKHWVNRNSVKMYDKHGVLRIETTINQPKDLKVYRPKSGQPEGEKAWRPLRKTVADLHRRAEVSRAANQRYLEAVGAMADRQPLGKLLAPLGRRPGWHGRQKRALNPLDGQDRRLLAAVGRGEFVLRGFRNRELRALLYPKPAADAAEEARRSGAVGRQLQLLRAHGLIRKVPKTHRYQLSQRGRQIVSALLTAEQADTQRLMEAAA
jgi:hypothetical protein